MYIWISRTFSNSNFFQFPLEFKLTGKTCMSNTHCWLNKVLESTATSISDKMGGPRAFDSLTPYTTVDPVMSSWICLFFTKSHNSRDQLMNHLRFHYRMVLICPIHSGCGSNSWRMIEAHIKACAKLRSTVASHKADPGEPLWWRSDNQLKGLTRAWRLQQHSCFQLGPILPMMQTRKTEVTSLTKP